LANGTRGTHGGYACSDNFLIAYTSTIYGIILNAVNMTPGFYIELVTLAATVIAK